MFEPSIDISDKTQRANILASLPAFKNQYDDSNNQKILNVIANLFIMNKNNLMSINEIMNVNNAQGQNLTDIGLDYGVERYDDDDEFLRFEIKWQILKSNTRTDMNSIKTLISVLMNISLQDFDIVKTDRPHEVELINIPFNFSSGSHSEQKREILANDLQSVLPAETILKDIQYSQGSDGTLYYAFTGNHTSYKESALTYLGYDYEQGNELNLNYAFVGNHAKYKESEVIAFGNI